MHIRHLNIISSINYQMALMLDFFQSWKEYVDIWFIANLNYHKTLTIFIIIIR